MYTPEQLRSDDARVPPEWERDLRAISPITSLHSWLKFVWYHAGERWVLYDCLPKAQIGAHDVLAVGFTAADFFEAVSGPPPRLLPAHRRSPFVSDLQHTLWWAYEVYARPFWVLQGESGGHQVAYTPWQANLFASKGLPTQPPPIGKAEYQARKALWDLHQTTGGPLQREPEPVYLEPCPFDQRAITQLQRMHRLYQMEGSLERLRQSGSAEFAAEEMQRMQRELREAQLAVTEAQMTPLTDMAMSLRQRSDAEDTLVRVKDGMAARAVDALQQYRETGEFPL